MAKIISIDAPRASRDRLVIEHADMVAPIARSLARGLPPSFDLDDLVGAGNLGLMYAAARFRPSFKTPFAIYARKCIRGHMLMSVRRAKYRDATNEVLEESPEPAAVIPFPDYSLRRRIDEAIAGLSPRLREVIELYYSREELTMEQVAARVASRIALEGAGFGKERASQLHMEAIRVLRELLKHAA